MRAEAVIGANYGDEGKGLFTDWLCANRPNPIVVMAKGGSQRGHTVELKDGKRHVFHHFGAGTFRGASTYFAKTFLLNPMQFVKEHEELKKLGYVPFSCRDPRCIIQLPCDIALNWHIEKCRGEKHHGSVGCGIWETVHRTRNCSYSFLNSLTFRKFCEMNYIEKLKIIRDQSLSYAKIRCAEVGVTSNIDLLDIFLSQGFAEHFIADTLRMQQLCQEQCANDLEDKYDHLVFENGQGLKLDQYYNITDLANTTPSYTGSIAIANILQNSSLHIDEVCINYISRTYLTKHGAGKFEEECPGMHFNDTTNVWNEWQEGLRFGELDYDALYKRIDLDFNYFKKFCPRCKNVKKSIAFTHANEVSVTSAVLGQLGFSCMYESSTDKANDIITVL